MKRWALRIFVFLLLGAIVNVAVAWGCVALQPRSTDWVWVWSHGGSLRWQTAIRVQFGVTSVMSSPPNRMWDNPATPPLTVDIGDWRIPYWSCARSRPSQSVIDDPVLPCQTEYAAGWPARSGLAIVKRDALKPGPQNTWYLASGLALELSRNRHRILPLRPIWPGFAINTVFYAVVLWLLFAAQFALRRRRRIKRGMCPKCAYDLRGTRGGPEGATACPECGAPVSLSLARERAGVREPNA